MSTKGIIMNPLISTYQRGGVSLINETAGSEPGLKEYQGEGDPLSTILERIQNCFSELQTLFQEGVQFTPLNRKDVHESRSMDRGLNAAYWKFFDLRKVVFDPNAAKAKKVGAAVAMIPSGIVAFAWNVTIVPAVLSFCVGYATCKTSDQDVIDSLVSKLAKDKIKELTRDLKGGLLHRGGYQLYEREEREDALGKTQYRYTVLDSLKGNKSDTVIKELSNLVDFCRNNSTVCKALRIRDSWDESDCMEQLGEHILNLQNPEYEEYSIL